jgi:hypothetical protein
VKVLEARFHPGSKSGQMSVVVARVHCDGSRTSIVPAPVSAAAVAPFEPVSLLDKLGFMVGSTVGDPFHALRSLRSGFWSFVEADVAS